jgi:hypothetical protein
VFEKALLALAQQFGVAAESEWSEGEMIELEPVVK